jgi:hypothetical protein
MISTDMASAPTPSKSLVLLNDFDVSPQTIISVSSASPINVGGITIWSATPLLISTTSSIKLASTAPLGAGFVRGWNKLSDELKTRVLSNILTLERAIDVDNFHVVNDACPATIQIYFKCLRSTPELAALAKPVFYSRNTFIICSTLVSGNQKKNWKAAYPHPDV